MDRFDKMLQKKLVDSTRTVGYHRPNKSIEGRIHHVSFSISQMQYLSESTPVARRTQDFFEERSIVEENPTYEELKEWYEKSGMPLKKFFNTKWQ